MRREGGNALWGEQDGSHSEVLSQPGRPARTPRTTVMGPSLWRTSLHAKSAPGSSSAHPVDQDAMQCVQPKRSTGKNGKKTSFDRKDEPRQESDSEKESQDDDQDDERSQGGDSDDANDVKRKNDSNKTRWPWQKKKNKNAKVEGTRFIKVNTGMGRTELVQCIDEKDKCQRACVDQFTTDTSIRRCIKKVDAFFDGEKGGSSGLGSLIPQTNAPVAGCCFPGNATVHERRKGSTQMRDVQLGDEILTRSGRYSRLLALLHDSSEADALYLCIRHDRGSLKISPLHLLYHQRRREEDQCADNKEAPSDGEEAAAAWSWAPAQDVRVGDRLDDGVGCELVVHSIEWLRDLGAFAPLTSDGALLVNGALCSCYSPPGAGWLTHSICHRVMLPLRVFEEFRAGVENWSRWDKSSNTPPALSLEPLWLLPTGSDRSLHPYASGLLQMVTVLDKFLLPLGLTSAPLAKTVAIPEAASRKIQSSDALVIPSQP